MSEPTIAQAHPNDVWKALLASVGVIGTLVSVLYSKLNKGLSDHSEKLDKGQETFADIGKQISILGEKIAHLQSNKVTLSDDLVEIEEDIKKLTERLTVLETEHHNCIPRKISMRGTSNDN